MGLPAMMHDMVLVSVSLLVGALGGWIIRGRQVKRWRMEYLMLNQVTGEYCEACGWAMKFPDAPCRCELDRRCEDLEKRLGQVIH